jgi:hypothetical protein
MLTNILFILRLIYFFPKNNDNNYIQDRGLCSSSRRATSLLFSCIIYIVLSADNIFSKVYVKYS